MAPACSLLIGSTGHVHLRTIAGVCCCTLCIYICFFLKVPERLNELLSECLRHLKPSNGEDEPSWKNTPLNVIYHRYGRSPGYQWVEMADLTDSMEIMIRTRG